MQKTLTKEQLAARLNGCEYRDDFPKELLELAKQNRLVIIHGSSDDIVSFSGAINDETYACDGGTVLLCKKGIPQNRCGNENCPYHAENLNEAVKYGAVREIQVFWCGQCKRETMDAVKYAALGKPTWMYETTMSHAVFDIFDTDGGEREYYCRAIILDLDEIWPCKSYAATMLDAVIVN